jgi:hypothetical protein
VSRLDSPPAAIPQSGLPQTPSVAANEHAAVPAPEPVSPPTQSQLEKQAAQPPALAPEPETTAAIPNPSAQRTPQNAVRHAPQPQQHAVRRPVPDSQRDNPLFQLFGIKQYR